MQLRRASKKDDAPKKAHESLVHSLVRRTRYSMTSYWQYDVITVTYVESSTDNRF